MLQLAVFGLSEGRIPPVEAGHAASSKPPAAKAAVFRRAFWHGWSRALQRFANQNSL